MLLIELVEIKKGRKKGEHEAKRKREYLEFKRQFIRRFAIKSFSVNLRKQPFDQTKGWTCFRTGDLKKR